MTKEEADVLARFLDEVLPGTDSRNVCVVATPRENITIGLPANARWEIHVYPADGAAQVLVTMHAVFNYMRLVAAQNAL